MSKCIFLLPPQIYLPKCRFWASPVVFSICGCGFSKGLGPSGGGVGGWGGGGGADREKRWERLNKDRWKSNKTRAETERLAKNQNENMEIQSGNNVQSIGKCGMERKIRESVGLKKTGNTDKGYKQDGGG